MSENPKKLSNIIVEKMEKEGVSIGQLSADTGIPENFIKLLIEDKIDQLPPRPYTHGYVLKICKALNLNGEKLWEEFLANSDKLQASGEQDKLPENRFAASLKGNKKAYLLGLLVLLVIGYFAFYVWTSLSIASDLTLSNLQDGTTVATSSEYTIKGKVNPQYQLTLNQNPVYPTTSGEFEKTVNLQPGLNTLQFTIKGFLGSEESITKKIIYNTKNSTTTVSTTSTEENNQTPTTY